MTQQEAEALLQVLKRKKAETVNAINQVYESERQRLMADQQHTLDRLKEMVKNAQIKCVEAKDELYRSRGKECWKEKALAAKTASAILQGYIEEISGINKYYNEQYRTNREKRDQQLRDAASGYRQEWIHIMDKVEHIDKEYKANYWKAKYYQLKAEMDKLKGDAA